VGATEWEIALSWRCLMDTPTVYNDTCTIPRYVESCIRQIWILACRRRTEESDGGASWISDPQHLKNLSELRLRNQEFSSNSIDFNSLNSLIPNLYCFIRLCIATMTYNLMSEDDDLVPRMSERATPGPESLTQRNPLPSYLPRCIRLGNQHMSPKYQNTQDFHQWCYYHLCAG